MVKAHQCCLSPHSRPAQEKPDSGELCAQSRHDSWWTDQALVKTDVQVLCVSAETWQQWEPIDMNASSENIEKCSALSAFLTSLVLA